MPVRVKKVYGINAPSYYEKLYALVKPVLPAELCNVVSIIYFYIKILIIYYGIMSLADSNIN